MKKIVLLFSMLLLLLASCGGVRSSDNITILSCYTNENIVLELPVKGEVPNDPIMSTGNMFIKGTSIYTIIDDLNAKDNITLTEMKGLPYSYILRFNDHVGSYLLQFSSGFSGEAIFFSSLGNEQVAPFLYEIFYNYDRSNPFFLKYNYEYVTTNELFLEAVDFYNVTKDENNYTLTYNNWEIKMKVTNTKDLLLVEFLE